MFWHLQNPRDFHHCKDIIAEGIHMEPLGSQSVAHTHFPEALVNVSDVTFVLRSRISGKDVSVRIFPMHHVPSTLTDVFSVFFTSPRPFL